MSRQQACLRTIRARTGKSVIEIRCVDAHCLTVDRESVPSPVPRLFLHVLKSWLAVVRAVHQAAFLGLVLSGALKLQHLIGATPDHTAPFGACPVRGPAAELAACCCISFVVFGDAFQDSSSRK